MVAVSVEDRPEPKSRNGQANTGGGGGGEEAALEGLEDLVSSSFDINSLLNPIK